MSALSAVVSIMGQDKEDLYARGVIKVLLATVLWGVGYPIWKVVATQIPPLPLTAISFSIAAIIMFFAFRLDLRALCRKFKANALILVVLGLFGGAFGTALIFYALSVIDSGVAALLEKLQPIFALLAARVLLKEHFAPAKIPYMLLVLPLSYAIAVPDPYTAPFHGVSFIGVMAAVGASFFYGISTVLSKYVVDDRLQPKELAFYRMWLGAIFIVPFLIIFPSTAQFEVPSLNTWLLLLAAILISLVWAFDLFFSGLRHIPAGVATFLELVTPIVALVLGMFFLDERVTFSQFLAMPFFIFCIFKISTRNQSSETPPSVCKRI